MSKTFKWIIGALVLLVALMLAAKFIGGASPEGLKVTAEKAQRQTIIEMVTASGKIFPEVEVKISPDVSGEIMALEVKEGDSVKKGQLLARIHSGSRRGPSIPSFPGLQITPGDEGRTTITAPMDGVISMLAVKKGERVVGTAQMAGTEMMRVADMSTLEIRTEVDEAQIIKVAVGDSADITVEAYNDRKFRGMVTQIAISTSKTGMMPLGNAGDATAYQVRIRLDPASYADLTGTGARRLPFRPGMNATADIKTSRRDNIIAVPTGAVTTRARGSDKSMEDEKKEARMNKGGEAADEEAGAADKDSMETVVYVIGAGSKAEKRIVATGIQDLKNIEIKTGLKVGEQIITAPFNAVSQTLKTGRKVAVVPQNKLF